MRSVIESIGPDRGTDDGTRGTAVLMDPRVNRGLGFGEEDRARLVRRSLIRSQRECCVAGPTNLPSRFCATQGGGTNLPTQRECLQMLGCVGTGKAKKLAEIIGATVLAGDISLASAIMADEFVDSHENLGRNR